MQCAERYIAVLKALPHLCMREMKMKLKGFMNRLALHTGKYIVFCKSEMAKIANKNGENCISILEKVASGFRRIQYHRKSTADIVA